MTLKKFKEGLSAALHGGRSVPSDENSLNFFIGQSLEQVARECKPLALTVFYKDKDVLEPCGDGLYILKPTIPETENEEFRMDEGLMYAVVYLTASKIETGKNSNDLEDEYDKVTSNYEWSLYQVRQSTHFDSDESFIKNCIDVFGYKKVYIKRYFTASGIGYIFDEEFINKYENYLANVEQNLSKSDLNNIDLYEKYLSGDLSSSHEDYPAFEKLKLYIEGL